MPSVSEKGDSANVTDNCYEVEKVLYTMIDRVEVKEWIEKEVLLMVDCCLNSVVEGTLGEIPTQLDEDPTQLNSESIDLLLLAAERLDTTGREDPTILDDTFDLMREKECLHEKTIESEDPTIIDTSFDLLEADGNHKTKDEVPNVLDFSPAQHVTIDENILGFSETQTVLSPPRTWISSLLSLVTGSPSKIRTESVNFERQVGPSWLSTVPNIYQGLKKNQKGGLLYFEWGSVKQEIVGETVDLDDLGLSSQQERNNLEAAANYVKFVTRQNVFYSKIKGRMLKLDCSSLLPALHNYLYLNSIKNLTMHEFRTFLYFNEMTCTAAAQRDDMKVMKWLRAQKPPCPWDEETCVNAVGSLSMIKWVRNQISPCPWDDRCCKEVIPREVECAEVVNRGGAPLSLGPGRML